MTSTQEHKISETTHLIFNYQVWKTQNIEIKNEFEVKNPSIILKKNKYIGLLPTVLNKFF